MSFFDNKVVLCIFIKDKFNKSKISSKIIFKESETLYPIILKQSIILDIVESSKINIEPISLAFLFNKLSNIIIILFKLLFID